MPELPDTLKEIVALPPFFLAVVVVIVLGLVFRLLRKTMKAAVTLVVLGLLIFAVIVFLQK